MIESRKLHVKNMVCPRCITAVKQLMDELEIPFQNVELGEIELKEGLDDEEKSRLNEALETVGFSLIDNRKSRLIEQMKNLIIQKIHHSQDVLDIKWAEYMADQLNYDYKYLGMLFSSVEGITLEQYIIRQKVERVKELMIYDELTLSQMAFQLGYSSAAHLSSQFKKITGMPPTQFKNTIGIKRKTLDNI
ncbi:AraC family transcriptional regulator [uncultured Marivirga sp.]|uniref:helix-turn-helix domain-containing protein n=1 Tax=uncultured Marivirga sp. TaxID=1123707 RepID=UPI0030ED54C7|tara:strand:+ start:135096 stop:135668 length:573 start_codon:yes stop_codon:yes gene_type:complete